MNAVVDWMTDDRADVTAVGSGGYAGRLEVPISDRSTGSVPLIATVKLGATSAALLGFLLGTGATYTIPSAHSGTGGNATRELRAAQVRGHANRLNPTGDALVSIKAAMGLSISDLATLANVERPTIYAWLEGSEPRSRNIERVSKLKMIAAEWQQLRLPIFRLVANQASPESAALRNLLAAGDLDLDSIRSVLARIATESLPQQSDLAKELVGKGYAAKPQRSQNRDRAGLIRRVLDR